MWKFSDESHVVLCGYVVAKAPREVVRRRLLLAVMSKLAQFVCPSGQESRSQYEYYIHRIQIIPKGEEQSIQTVLGYTRLHFRSFR